MAMELQFRPEILAEIFLTKPDDTDRIRAARRSELA